MTSYAGTLTLTGSVTIAVTGGPVAHGSAGYELLGCGLDSIQRRRDVVDSPWIKGDAEVASVQGPLTYTFSINAVGTDLAGAIAAATAVISLVQETTWTLTETLNGHTETFACRAAISVESAFERELVINARKNITVNVPVKRV